MNFKRLISVPGIALMLILAGGFLALYYADRFQGLWAWSGVAAIVLYLFLKK